jgi:hypothetical protein
MGKPVLLLSQTSETTYSLAYTAPLLGKTDQSIMPPMNWFNLCETKLTLMAACTMYRTTAWSIRLQSDAAKEIDYTV